MPRSQAVHLGEGHAQAPSRRRHRDGLHPRRVPMAEAGRTGRCGRADVEEKPVSGTDPCAPFLARPAADARSGGCQHTGRQGRMTGTNPAGERAARGAGTMATRAQTQALVDGHRRESNPEATRAEGDRFASSTASAQSAPVRFRSQLERTGRVPSRWRGPRTRGRLESQAWRTRTGPAEPPMRT